MSVSHESTYESIAKTCACFHLRRASRFVTGLYDRALSGEELTSTQFVLLLVLALSNRAKITDVAESLGMDRTTLTRLMAPLKKRKLVKISTGTDRRIKILTLTASGRSTLDRCVPLWKKAQAKILDLFGSSEWEQMVDRLEKTAEL